MPEQKKISLELLSIPSLNLYNSVTDVKPDILLRKDSAFGWVKSLCSPQPNLNTKKKKKNRDKQITPYTSPLKRLSHCRCSLQTEETAENRLRKVKVLLWRVTPPTIIIWKS
ncbi:hypothetical protein NC651_009729 [Populus alba x Populus x berolinensis]|nr:hypothetical protein NC651_009729 [Populus alba x Populus x berolinensis]